jgi:MFS family permease
VAGIDPPLRRFLAVQVQSQVGTGAAFVALILVAHSASRTAWAISLVLLADLLPGVVLAPLCGALADRYSRTRLLVIGELLRAAAFGALSLVHPIMGIVLLALLAGVGSSLFSPAAAASIAELAPEERRPQVIAIWTATSDAGIALGPILAALLLLVVDPRLILAINGLTFLISAAALRSIGTGRRARSGQVTPPERRGVFDAWRLTKSMPGIPTLLLVGGLATLAGSMVNVIEPLFVTGTLHGSGFAYAVLMTCFGGGMLLSAPLTIRVGNAATARNYYPVALMVTAVGCVGSGLAQSMVLAAATFALTGVACSMSINMRTIVLQYSTPGQYLGRIFGLKDAIVSGAFCCGFLLAGATVSLFGTRESFFLAAGGLFLSGAISWALHPVSPRTLTGASSEATRSAVAAL